MKYLKTVLLSSAGTGAAYSSAVALRKNWGDSIRILTADINPSNLVTCSLIADKHFEVPLNDDTSYKKSLYSILSKENVDTYIPFIDHEIYIGALLYEENADLHQVSLQVKTSEIADICNDKYKTFAFLTENQILTPQTFLISEQDFNDPRCIIKPRKGFGSKIIRKSDFVTNFSDFDPEKYLIQYECSRPEITVDVCYDKSREYFTYVCRERIEVKSGVCTKARLFLNKEIELIAFKIAERLNLSSFCFQLMDFDGAFAVTDINARLGAGTAMSVAAGMDFFSGMFAILWGDDPSKYFRSLQKEIFVTRQYSEFVMNM